MKFNLNCLTNFSVCVLFTITMLRYLKVKSIIWSCIKNQTTNLKAWTKIANNNSHKIQTKQTKDTSNLNHWML